MTWVLVRKLLRDVRVPWCVAAILLFLFQLLWSRITQRVTSQILAAFARRGVSPELLQQILFDQNEFPAQMIQAIIGGENIALDRASDLMSVSYVHPLVITILCVWAIGRAANAIAGEIDRGTMELLLAQPIRRSQIVFAHLWVDVLTFPSLCLVLWTGTYLGTWWMDLQDAPHARQRVDPLHFLPALVYMIGLLFAVSGVTMWISSMGRSRSRVWGWAVSVMLSMFLINVLGQIWNDSLDWMRPLTIFYHYQPQPVILNQAWYKESAAWLHLAVLFAFGAGGYFLAWLTFTRRDLPAPL